MGWVCVLPVEQKAMSPFNDELIKACFYSNSQINNRECCGYHSV